MGPRYFSLRAIQVFPAISDSLRDGGAHLAAEYGRGCVYRKSIRIS